MNYKKITLRRGKEESLARRHPWIFSGAVDSAAEEIFEGDIVDVYSQGGDFLARGHSQVGSIAVRVLTFADEAIDQTWWNERILSAYKLRQALGLVGNSAPGADSKPGPGSRAGSDSGIAGTAAPTTAYRLVHGEGDLLPGLVVDIYGSTAVIQCHSVGMYFSRDFVAAAIGNAYGGKITAVFDKSSQTLPFKADIGAVDGYVVGSCHDQEQILENGYRFIVNWEKGQKTGFFIDQRENRELVRRYAHGRKVLNTFAYTGGFSVYALSGGAVAVDSVDSSARAIELAARNVGLNFGDKAPHRAIAEDAFDFLGKADAGQYDMIILDPPAFAKHHKVLGNAMQGYRRLNARAMQKIAPGGILFTFSCSQAVSREMFRTMIFSAAAIAGRKVRILHQLTQPADHPINIYHPEGEYLKGLVLYVE